LGAGCALGLGLHLIGDAELLVYASKLSTGSARRDRSNGLRLEQRLLERRRRADVGFGRAGANRHADAHPGDVGRRPGRDLSTRPSIFPDILGYDTKSNRALLVAIWISAGVVP
jgi:hypothetical protein